jgi:hypothetical protein
MKVEIPFELTTEMETYLAEAFRAEYKDILDKVETLLAKTYDGAETIKDAARLLRDRFYEDAAPVKRFSKKAPGGEELQQAQRGLAMTAIDFLPVLEMLRGYTEVHYNSVHQAEESIYEVFRPWLPSMEGIDAP